jgi:chromosome partitioning protein
VRRWADATVKTVVVMSMKGGAGKTTLATSLAQKADSWGLRVILFDADSQASAAAWADARPNEIGPVVKAIQVARLALELQAVEELCDLAVIDTAPRSDADAVEAAQHSDLALVVVRPSIHDLRAVGRTLQVLRLAGTPAIAVLNAVPPRGTLADEAEEALAAYGLEVAPVRLGDRIAHVHAASLSLTASEYEPKGLAAAEISRLWDWLTSLRRLEVVPYVQAAE